MFKQIKSLHEVIDIYTKLVIAIISFIAPLMIHLLSMFGDALAHLKRRADIEVSQMDELVKSQVQQDGVQIQELISRSTSLYKDREKKLKRQKNILDPKRQIKRVFPTLFLSLIFLALYSVADSKEWFKEEGYNDIICIVLFSLSFICAGIGVIFLKCIAWTVIDIKELLAQQDKEKTVEVKKVENII